MNDSVPLVSHGVPAHIFHRSCLERAAEMDQRCPLCRERIHSIQPIERGNEDVALVADVPFSFAPDAMRLAVERGDMATLQNILESGGVSEISIARALGAAASLRNLEIIRLIHSHFPLDESLKRVILHEAAQTPHREIIDFIMGLGPLEENSSLVIVREGTRRNDINLIRMLQQTESGISRNHAQNGILIASQGGHFELLQMFYNIVENQVDEYFVKSALIHVASVGYLECLEFILSRSQVSEDQRGCALNFAASSGHIDCVRALYFDGNILARDWQRALISAQQEGRDDIVQFINRYQGR